MLTSDQVANISDLTLHVGINVGIKKMKFNFFLFFIC